jgi:signal transduction histidine kinase
MTFFIISALLNSITSTFCGLFVLLNNPKEKTNQTFFYFSSFIALWATFQFLWLINAAIPEKGLLYSRLSNMFAAFIPITFFHFASHLINEYKKYVSFIKIIYIIAIIIFLTGFSNLFIPRIVSHGDFFPYWPVAGPTFSLMFLEYIFILGYSLLIIHNKIKTSLKPESLQLKYVFYGILIAYLSGSTNFPLCYNIPIPPFTNILVPFYTIFITYAALRYNLMNIQIIIKRSLIYTILITIISIFYLLSIYSTEHFFQITFGYKSIFTSLFSATMIALAFIPLRNTIEHLLFKGSVSKIAEENDLLRQELIRSERMKMIATLASGMAHEIKNPLTPIKTFAEQLPKRLEDKEFLLKFSKIIGNEVNRIDSLVQELLDFAKPAALHLKETNLHQLLDHTLDFLNNDLIKHKITVIKNYEIPIGKTLALDENQFRQALLNLFLNAIDAMPHGGTLSVRTTNETNCVITITDSGTGISKEDMPHIFDPFFSKKDQGTGLGLAITHEIIKNHNGKILVESNADEGTMFIITLPYHATQ